MRIPIRTSKLAIWSRRAGGLALPMLVLSAILHRTGALDTETFLLIAILGMGLAFLALLLGIAAVIRLWFTGDRGWGRAVAGIVSGVISLAPLGAAAVVGSQYPLGNVVETQDAAGFEFVSEQASVPLVPIDETQTALAYPQATPRRYAVPVNTLYRLVTEQVADKGWEVIARKPPQLEVTQGQINALASTLLGFQDEVVIGVLQRQDGSELVMKSRSLNGEGDLGTNGRRIESFLADMDEAVILEARREFDVNAPPTPAERPGN